MLDKRRRRGTTLVEVLVALVVLATTGTTLIALLGQTRQSMRDIRDSERLITAASAELDRLVVFDHDQIAALRGRSSVGAWTLEVVQLTPDLFDVSIASTDSGAALLTTTMYRPDTTRAALP